MIDKPTVIDFFPYSGEEIVLEIRLNELSSVITKFIISESNRTQTGLEKPYYFEQQKEKFKDFAGQIIYIKLDDSHLDKLGGVNEADWNQEFRVRESLVVEGIQALQNEGVILMANDIILVSDCDEIPKKEFVEWFIKSNEKIIVCNHYFNSYYLNLFSEFRKPWGWYGSILFKCGAVSLTPQTIRRLRTNKDNLPKTFGEGEGWHFSSLLTDGFNSLYSKYLRNIEPHSKSCLENKEELEKQFNKCLYEDSCFFFCDRVDDRSIKFEILDFESLPEYVKKNKKSFKKLLFCDSHTV